MIYVANPIYDSVFKYLMEDERVAKTVLSALLKEDVVSVKLRPHEYSNETNDKISMFRIDFSARISTGENETELLKIKEQREQLNRQTNQLNLQSERLNLQSEQLDSLKRILKEQGFSDADIQRMMSNK